MANIVRHRKVKILSLALTESLAEHGKPGMIVIDETAEGWWLHFFSADGSVDSYDQPYASYPQALGAAKAAAEFGFD